nr:hypothetical protein [uncultured Rhodoferax sp.]
MKSLPKRIFGLCVLLIWLLLFVIYSSGLRGDFAFDDYVNIVNNPSLRADGDTKDSLLSAASSGITSPLGRPISMVSFALNYSLFGEKPFSFKLTNLVIHYVNALLMFLLITQLTRSTESQIGKQDSYVLATAVAITWAVHPLNAMPVLHVVQRMTSLSALFMLLALCLYIYGRRSKTLPGHISIVASLVVCWPAAIYSKETGLLLPLYLVLIEWLVLGTFKRLAKNTIRWGCVIVGCLVLFVCWANWAWIVGGYRMRDFTLAERLYTEPRVLWFYIQQLLVPIPQLYGLYHDDIAISRGWFDPPGTILAAVGWVTVAVLAFSQRNRRPLFTFAVFWFLASHILESTILPLEIAHEHRNYLASVGLFWWLASQLLSKETTGAWKRTKIGLTSSFIVLCGVTTSIRSAQWSDDFSRKQGEVVNHPQSPRANYEYAIAVLNSSFDIGHGSVQAYELVHMHLLRAEALNPSGKAALLGVLYLDCAAGKAKNSDALGRLSQRFANAPFAPGDRSVISSLSAMFVENKLCLDDGEVQSLINAGLSNPTLDGAFRGMLYAVAMDYAAARLKSLPLALEYAQAAVANDPSAVALRINLIHLYLAAGKVDRARQEHTRALLLPISIRDKRTLVQLESKLEATAQDGIRH